MLIVSRRDDESIQICPIEGVDLKMTLEDLFKDGPIEITIFSSSGSRVKMGVQAPEELCIWRKGATAAA